MDAFEIFILLMFAVYLIVYLFGENIRNYFRKRNSHRRTHDNHTNNDHRSDHGRSDLRCCARRTRDPHAFKDIRSVLTWNYNFLTYSFTLPS